MLTTLCYNALTVDADLREVRSQLTRKPSWRKGKRATTVHVWRPIL